MGRLDLGGLEYAEEVGALVDIGRVIEVEGHRVEILKSFADCTGTAIAYRSPRMSGTHPILVWPPEAARGGSSGGGDDDFLVGGFGPVLPHRREVLISFANFGRGMPFEGDTYSVPVDRSRTAAHDRFLSQPVPDPVETEGLSFRLLDACSGLLGGVAEVIMGIHNPSILAAELGWPDHGRRMISAEEGPRNLWEEWRPRQPDSGGTTFTRRLPGGWMVTGSSARIGSMTGIARAELRSQGPPPQRPPEERPPEPRSGVDVVALPHGESLRLDRWGQRAEGAPRRNGMIHNVEYEAPPQDATGIELVIRPYASRFAGGDVVTVPNPSHDSKIDLTGAAFSSPDGRVELLRWEPNHGSYSLIMSALSPDWWLDVRVLIGEESVSLWAGRGAGGTIHAGLPAMYNEAFERPEGVKLALRMISKPAPEVRLAAPLSPPR
jgi:hypothetical protein